LVVVGVGVGWGWGFKSRQDLLDYHEFHAYP
jgi:hypothetical protein